MSVTMEDVAAKAGVSLKTVSRVVNGEEGVKADTQARVWQVIAETGYVPHASARQLASGRANVLGLVLPYIDSPYSNVILSHILRYASTAGFHVLVEPDYYLEGQRPSIVDLSLSRQIDGIIFGAHSWHRELDLLNELEALDAPVTLIEPDLPADHAGKFSMVTITNTQGAFHATEYLLGLGHRRVGFITCKMDLGYSQKRLAGYQDALRQHGLEVSPDLVYEGDGEYGEGFHGAQVLLARSPRPTAIFASTDQMALAVIQAALQLGLRVPEDLSVVGFDDIPLAVQLFPPLTTVHQPLDEIARKAVEMTIRGLQESTREARIELVATNLVVRESCVSPVK